MEKQTVYINGRFLTQKITGVQRYAIEVVKQLDKEENINFIILCPKQEIENNIELKNIEIRKIGKLKGQIWEQISLPLYILKNGRKKLLSLCNLAPIIYPGYVTIHDIGFKTHGEHLEWKFRTWYKFVTKLNIKRYKHIFTVSEFSKKEIIKNYKINENKITVTYNSAEHLNGIKPNEEILKKYDLKENEFYFSLGSRSPHKNHKYIEQLAKNNPNLKFVVTGNNNSKVFKDNNEETISNMIYTGYLDDKELAGLYKNCKAFIFPSLYEGFGIPPLEAMTMECKNIYVSDIEVFKEIYKDNVNYINVIEPKYNEIFENTINNTKNVSEDFKWDDVEKKILKIMEDTIEKN